MGDGQHGGRKKKASGQSKSYYYALTYDEEDSGSVDETGNDEVRNRVASILAETELAASADGGSTSGIDGRLDFNDNLFGGDGSLRNSRSLDFDLSDDEFQSAEESRSDAGKPEVETGSADEDFVQITRPEVEGREGHGGSEDGASGQGSGSSPRTSGSGRPSGSSPLAVVYVKQKTMSELYDGKFIDDDILQPQEERITAPDNVSIDLLPMPVEEMTLEMIDEEEDDGIPDSGSGIDPIIFRKSSDRWCARHRKLVIGVLVALSVLVAVGLAVIIYFAVYAAR